MMKRKVNIKIVLVNVQMSDKRGEKKRKRRKIEQINKRKEVRKEKI